MRTQRLDARAEQPYSVLCGVCGQIEPSQRERVRRAVLELWYITADACGTDEYKAMIEHLSEHEAFHEAWKQLPFLTESDSRQIGLPRRASRPDIGESLIAPFVAIMPPVYQVRQLIPMDKLARDVLEEIQGDGAPEPVFDLKSHWAQTEENEAFVRVF